MKNKQIIGLVVAGAVFIVTGVTSVLTNTFPANVMAPDSIAFFALSIYQPEASKPENFTVSIASNASNNDMIAVAAI